MKLIFFNVWDAEFQEGIEAFLKKYSTDTDIFCFQEAGDKMKDLCKCLLPDYTAILDYKYLNKQDEFPQATYVRDSLKIERAEPLLKDTPNVGLSIYTRVKNESGVWHICNFHGISMPGDKSDTPERLQQSAEVIKFFKGLRGPKIIGGDFNLELNTESVAMFEKSGYRNLIKDFDIKTTRNRLVWEKYPESKQYFSDYIFVSPDVEVKDFSVEDIEVSDHLPMILSIRT